MDKADDKQAKLEQYLATNQPELDEKMGAVKGLIKQFMDVQKAKAQLKVIMVQKGIMDKAGAIKGTIEQGARTVGDTVVGTAGAVKDGVEGTVKGAYSTVKGGIDSKVASVNKGFQAVDKQADYSKGVAQRASERKANKTKTFTRNYGQDDKPIGKMLNGLSGLTSKAETFGNKLTINTYMTSAKLMVLLGKKDKAMDIMQEAHGIAKEDANSDKFAQKATQATKAAFDAKKRFDAVQKVGQERRAHLDKNMDTLEDKNPEKARQNNMQHKDYVSTKVAETVGSAELKGRRTVSHIKLSLMTNIGAVKAVFRPNDVKAIKKGLTAQKNKDLENAKAGKVTKTVQKGIDGVEKGVGKVKDGIGSLQTAGSNTLHSLNDLKNDTIVAAGKAAGKVQEGVKTAGREVQKAPHRAKAMTFEAIGAGLRSAVGMLNKGIDSVDRQKANAKDKMQSIDDKAKNTNGKDSREDEGFALA